MTGTAGKIAKVEKPCPFCGHSVIRRDDDGYMEWLTCDSCNATGGMSPDARAANLSLEQAWDSRPRELDAKL